MMVSRLKSVFVCLFLKITNICACLQAIKSKRLKSIEAVIDGMGPGVGNRRWADVQ